MKEIITWDVPLPKVTLEDVFQAEGADYSKRPPHKNTIKLHQRILDHAAEWVKPKAIWREIGIKHVKGYAIVLEDDHVLTSPLLTKMAGSAEKLLLFAVTIGEEIEERLSLLREEGKIGEAFALDATGTAFVTKVSLTVLHHLEELYHRMNLKTTFPMGPGHSYWNKIEDLKTIFHYLQSDQVNLRLTDSNFILPRKSAAMVIGIGKDLPDSHEKTHCSFCSLQKTCPLSQAKKE